MKSPLPATAAVASIQRFPRNTTGRDFAVGDIHGAFDALQRGLDAIRFDPQRDRLFSTGDLVDRGPQSHEVLAWLDKPWFHAVCGNHDFMAWRSALGHPYPEDTLAATADHWLLRALVEASQCLGQAERKSLKQSIKNRPGGAWLLEDPSRHDRKVSVTAHLDATVLKNASTQKIRLTFTEIPQVEACKSLANHYHGTFIGIGSANAVFQDLDMKALLADAEASRLEVRLEMPALTEVLIVDTGECLYERLPPVEFPTPAEKDVETKAMKDVLSQTDVLLITTADIEKRAVLAKFAPLPGKDSVLVGSVGNITYRLGQFGRYAAAHVHTTQGADGRGGATLSVRDASSAGTFKACLLIGIAFGFDRQKQRLGDVLVAEHIQPYEHARVQGDNEHVVPRGAALPCGTVLSDRFRNRMGDWDRKRTVSQVAIHQGTVLAGGKLINSRPFRDRLYNTFQHLKPVGGEMEGHGAYAAAQNSKVEIILVKAICDWADGEKSDRAQPFSAEMAVDACHHLLCKPDVLSDLGASDLGLPTKSDSQPDVATLFRTPDPDASDESDQDNGPW